MKYRLLGLGSIFCPVFVILASVTLALMPLSVNVDGEIAGPMLPFFVTGMILLILSVIGTWFFIIYDIIHAAKNDAFSGGKKAAWICAIWFLNVFVIPIYWAKHLKQKHRTAPPALPSPAPRAGEGL